MIASPSVQGCPAQVRPAQVCPAQVCPARDLHARFTAILPRIVTHLAIRFRRLPASQREETIAEGTAAAYVNYRSLHRALSRTVARPQAGRATAATLAGFAARHVAQDRHVGGRQSSSDVLSPLAGRRHGFAVTRLASSAGEPGDWRGAMLEDHRVTPAAQAVFNLDFQHWLGTFCSRDRRIINRLAAGESTFAVADRFGVTASRISQLRRRFERSWAAFQGELVGQAQAGGPASAVPA